MENRYLLQPRILPGRIGEVGKDIFKGQRESDLSIVTAKVFGHIQVG